MKQLFVLIVLLLSIATGYAQQKSVVPQQQVISINQIGNNLTTNITQSDPTNVVVILQDGGDHSLNVSQQNGATFNRAGFTQYGTSQTATISQSNGSGGSALRGGSYTPVGDGNWAGTTQQGVTNRATVTQDGANTKSNYAEIWQLGSNNGNAGQGPSSINQNGALNGRAEIFQGDDSYEGGEPGHHPSPPSTLVTVSGNGATIDQSGSANNIGQVKQFSNDNKSAIFQSGPASRDNLSLIRQGNGGNVGGQSGNQAIIYQEQENGLISRANQARIIQTGQGGLADIRQRKSATDNTAFINQVSGQGSHAELQQEFDAFHNGASIEQRGNNQVTYTSQVKAQDNILSVGQRSDAGTQNVAYAFQTHARNGTLTIHQNAPTGGNQNFAELVQGFYLDESERTDYNTASVEQTGNGNQTRLLQNGAGSHSAIITQTGDNNIVTGTAGVPNPLNGGSTYGPADPRGALQQGYKNSLLVTQTSPGSTNGNPNTAALSQDGTSNVGIAVQSGTGHILSLVQNGSTFNRGGFTQNGTNQTSGISQGNGSGGGSLREGSYTPAGDGNWAGTTQNGTGNRAGISQDGANTKGNYTEIWQNGSSNGNAGQGPSTVSQNGATSGRAEIFQGDDSYEGGAPGHRTGQSTPATIVAVANNGATIDQGGSSNNVAQVKQFSNDNKSRVFQSGANSQTNSTLIKQGNGLNVTGQSGNQATVYQEEADGLLTRTNRASITQTGKTGIADIRQRKSATDNVATINQTVGQGAVAYVQQEFDAFHNTATVNQFGNQQTAFTSHVKAKDNTLTIEQGSASLTGSSQNTVYAFQTHARNNALTIRQNTVLAGTGNFAEVVQGFYLDDPDRTDYNTATTDQNGDRNQIRLLQNGTGYNSATIGQTGNNNVVGGTAGVPDPAHMDTSYGPADPRGALQQGYKNTMTVTQLSPNGTNSSVFNTAALSQTNLSNAIGNTLLVDQTAVTSSNIATVNQTGSMNMATVHQVGNN